MKSFILLLISLLPWKLCNLGYRFLGYKISWRAKIGFFVIIDAKGKVVIDHHACIKSFVYIKCHDLIMDSNSTIASFCMINSPIISIGRDSLISNCVIIRSGHVSKESGIIIGDLVHIFPFVIIDCSRLVTIGDETGIGSYCNIYTHSAYKSILQGYRVTYGNITIGKRVELTYNVFVAPGVTIEDDAICSYGSYVNKNVPSGTMVAGLPAVIKRTKEQIIGDVSDIEKENILQKIINDYNETITIINNRKPIRIILICNKSVETSESKVIYLLYNSEIKLQKNCRYAVFDICKKICFNHGLEKKDFKDFRKFLSRYGIKFLTKDIGFNENIN